MNITSFGIADSFTSSVILSLCTIAFGFNFSFFHFESSNLSSLVVRHNDANNGQRIRSN